MELNNKLVDWWMVPHFLRGFLLASFVKKRGVALLIFVGSEILENTIFREMQDFKEGPVNLVSDIAFDTLGFEINKKFGNKKI